MSDSPVVTRIGDGVFRVELNGQAHIVHAAGTADDLWLHWNGHVFRRPFAADASATRTRAAVTGPQTVTAPMPATVLKVLVAPGDAVTRNQTLVLLEAMKMELPLRAPADGTVRLVHCRDGELVQPGATLVELE